MMTEELKRSHESYVQKVLELAKEVSKTHNKVSVQELYWALRDVAFGLRTAIQGLEDLQKLYGRGDLSYSIRDIRETLADYHSIAHTTSIDALETLKAFIERELGRTKASE